MADLENQIADKLLDIISTVSQNVTDNNTKAVVKNATARVISYDEDTYKAVVYFTDDEANRETNQYTFYNNTPSKLGVDDIVYIQYTNNRANGKLLIKNGEPDPMSSGGGSTECVGIFGNDGKNSVIFNDFANSTASGIYDFTSGHNNKNTGSCCNVSGDSNTISGFASVISGGSYNTINGSGSSSINGGTDNKITSGGTYNAISGGSGNIISSGSHIHISGSGNTSTSSHYSEVCGASNTLINTHSSFISGNNNSITGGIECGILGGQNNQATYENSVTLGGLGLIANRYFSAMCGRYNTSEDSGNSALFIVGNGWEGLRSNAFRVDTDGNAYAGNSINGTGADFAETLEWLDGNPNNEDRVGLFVTLDGRYIKFANADDDYVLGVVSALPTITGNTASEVWYDMYVRDIFGRPQTHEVTVPAKTIEETNPETGEVTTREISPEHTEIQFIINPDYDNTKPYISRENRPEYDKICITGIVVVIDDGTCEVNGYCKSGNNGIGTKSDTKTIYRVMERLDDTHIRVMAKKD